MELLDKAMILIGADASKAPLLSLLIEEAQEDAINYCNLTEYNSKMDSIILQMVRFKYNRLGTEAISSNSFSGISESYKDDYSKTVYEQLRKFRRIRTI